MSRRLPPKSYVYIPKGSLPSLEVTRTFMYTTPDEDCCNFAGIVYDKQKYNAIHLIRDGGYMWSYYPPSSDFKQAYFNTLGGL